MSVTQASMRIWWERATWPIPLGGVVFGLLLERLVAYVDTTFYVLGSERTDISASSATAILAAIGGGMVTFAGFVFSFVLLIVQFGSSAYSPRTVSYFLQARLPQFVLAHFLATITFSLTGLISVGSVDSDFVPLLVVQLSVLMLLLSLVGFIMLLYSTGLRIRIDQVVQHLGVLARRHLRKLPKRQADATDQEPWLVPAGVPIVVRHTGRNGQLVDIDQRRMLGIARRRRARIEVMVRRGDALSKGTPVAIAYGTSRKLDDLSINSALVVSAERSLVHDPRYALRILVDIGIRALSPAVNDPTTAVRVLDEVEAILRTAAVRQLSRIRRTSRNGEVLFPGMGWERLVDLALLEILSAGAGQPQVVRRLVALTDDLLSDLPDDRKPAIEVYRSDLRKISLDGLPSRAAAIMRFPDRQGLGGGPVAGPSLGE